MMWLGKIKKFIFLMIALCLLTEASVAEPVTVAPQPVVKKTASTQHAQKKSVATKKEKTHKEKQPNKTKSAVKNKKPTHKVTAKHAAAKDKKVTTKTTSKKKSAPTSKTKKTVGKTPALAPKKSQGKKSPTKPEKKAGHPTQNKATQKPTLTKPVTAPTTKNLPVAASQTHSKPAQKLLPTTTQKLSPPVTAAANNKPLPVTTQKVAAATPPVPNAKPVAQKLSPVIQHEPTHHAVHATKAHTDNNSPPSSSITLEQRLISYVQKTVSHIHSNVYKFGGSSIDVVHGVFAVDCSRYVDHILHKVYPHAYSNLVSNCGSEKPTSQEYYNFFSRLSAHSKHYWNKVDTVKQLRPGDILVFRYKSDGDVTGGHVMVVMNKPVQNTNTFAVRVADSAMSGHSEDTRHSSGIGIGTLLIKANPHTGQPAAYAWSTRSYFDTNVIFAMARPRDIL